MLSVVAPILIPLAMILLTATLKGFAGESSWRDCIIRSALFTGAWVVAGCELLSYGHAMTFPFVLAWWLGPCIGLGIVLWRRRDRAQAWLGSFARPDWTTVFLLLVMAPLAILTFVIAISTPPTTWDSLSYHMPRQVYWMLQGGVQHYAAQDLRQLEMPPFAEFVGVHLLILAKHDWPANMVQWMSLVLGAVSASAIARDLGGKRASQALAALLVFALPSALTQSVNAKNDVVLAALALASLQITHRIWMSKRCTWMVAAELSIAAGLMVLTKGTGFIIALPVGLLAAAGIIRASGMTGVRMGVAMVAVAAMLNQGHAQRNYEAFGNPLHLPEAQGGYALTNTTHAPAAIASNVIRNLALALSPPDDGMRDGVLGWVQRRHADLGLATQDIRITWPGSAAFEMRPLWGSDGNNPAPIHVLLYASALLVLGMAAIRRRAPTAWLICLVPLAAFLVFCIVLKWQPWHNRLLIPVFALTAPIVARLIGNRMAVLQGGIGVAAAGVAASALVLNEGKPLYGPHSIIGRSRESILFTAQPHYEDVIERLVSELKRRAPRCIGFAHESQTTYYVLRPLVFSGLRSIRIVPVTAGPDPANERLPPPDLIVIWLPDERLPNVAMFKGVQYSLATVIPVAPGRQITVVVPAYPIVIMEPSNAPGSPAAPPPVPGPR